MKLIPKERIELNTKLSKGEVYQILHKNIVSKITFINKFKLNIDDNCFEGTIKDDRFKIERVVYRKSFVPILIGQIESNDNETKIIVELKIRNSTLSFVIISLTFVLFAFILGIVGVIKQNVNPFLLIFPVILFSFILILMNTTFAGERERAIDYLRKILRSSK